MIDSLSDRERAALDRQYNLRAAFPDFPEHVRMWQEMSEQSVRKHDWQFDIPYGAHDSMKLDLCRPKGAVRATHVFFHGGYWQAMGREYFRFIGSALAGMGILTVLPSYPLAPRASMREIVTAAAAAVSWTWHHAVSSGMPCDTLSLSGHSAGAHLAACVCDMAFRDELRPLPRNVVESVIGLSGVYDLNPVRTTYLNETLKLTKDDCAQFSPALQLTGTNAFLNLLIGQKETDEFHRQQREYADRCVLRGRRVKADVIPNLHHFDLVTHAFTAESDVFRRICHAILERTPS